MYTPVCRCRQEDLIRLWPGSSEQQRRLGQETGLTGVSQEEELVDQKQKKRKEKKKRLFLSSFACKDLKNQSCWGTKCSVITSNKDQQETVPCIKESNGKIKKNPVLTKQIHFHLSNVNVRGMQLYVQKFNQTFSKSSSSSPFKVHICSVCVAQISKQSKCSISLIVEHMR